MRLYSVEQNRLTFPRQPLWLNYCVNNYYDTETMLSSAVVSKYKNSSGDEIANANFDAVRPENTQIRWNDAK